MKLWDGKRHRVSAHEHRVPPTLGKEHTRSASKPPNDMGEQENRGEAPPARDHDAHDGARCYRTLHDGEAAALAHARPHTASRAAQRKELLAATV